MSLDQVKSHIQEWNLDKALDLLSDTLMENPEAKILASTIFIQKGLYEKAIQIGYEALEQGEGQQDFEIQSKARTNISYALWWSGQIELLDSFIEETEIIYHSIPKEEQSVRLH